jgi:hypothetical protein
MPDTDLNLLTALDALLAVQPRRLADQAFAKGLRPLPIQSLPHPAPLNRASNDRYGASGTQV